MYAARTRTGKQMEEVSELESPGEVAGRHNHITSPMYLSGQCSHRSTLFFGFSGSATAAGGSCSAIASPALKID